MKRVGEAMGEWATSYDRRPASAIGVRTRVAVRDHYLGDWSRGFEVAQVVKGGYRIRRLSDGSLLPVELSFDEVRRDVPAPSVGWL